MEVWGFDAFYLNSLKNRHMEGLDLFCVLDKNTLNYLSPISALGKLVSRGVFYRIGHRSQGEQEQNMEKIPKAAEGERAQEI